MILEIQGRNVPDAFREALWAVRVGAFESEDSRNGRVMAVPYPSMLTIKNPVQRVLFDPIRDANPFFHVMEWVWMLAGSNDAVWLSQFNKRMLEYSNDGILRGAYGWRWRHPTDQLGPLINLLRRDKGTRQAVLSMWVPDLDGGDAATSDRPCNTHIYFRVCAGRLDMTVCNRSNDLFWGMMGANSVHMTFLHELIALASGVPIGTYRVFTNNLHVYESTPRLQEMLARAIDENDWYVNPWVTHTPLLEPKLESWEDLREDCENILAGLPPVGTYWAGCVAWPMHQAYLDKDNRDEWIKRIRAPDWQLACEQWVARRTVDSQSSGRELPRAEVPHGASDTRGNGGGAHGGNDGNSPGPDQRPGEPGPSGGSSVP